jgi:hypothetical protein
VAHTSHRDANGYGSIEVAEEALMLHHVELHRTCLVVFLLLMGKVMSGRGVHKLKKNTTIAANGTGWCLSLPMFTPPS